jgi:dihydrolipoamide dehydrogenase
VAVQDGEPLAVDERLRVGGRDWLYAIGDLNGRAAFTHMAKYQARIAADAILGREDTAIENPADGPHAPRMIFTDPQVGAVGHTTESAAEAGLDVEVIDVETSATAGGTFYGHGAAGTTRVLVDRARGVIAGATVTGSEVVDLLHPFTIAVALEIPLERLKHAVPVFPTRTELWLAIFRKAGVA